jgi:hypothetical protein
VVAALASVGEATTRHSDRLTRQLLSGRPPHFPLSRIRSPDRRGLWGWHAYAPRTAWGAVAVSYGLILRTRLVDLEQAVIEGEVVWVPDDRQRHAEPLAGAKRMPFDRCMVGLLRIADQTSRHTWTSC